MEIIIVGGSANPEITQATMAALVQAGIHVSVTEVDSIKVAVNVSGGNVQEATANVPLSLKIVDYDNLSPGDEGYQEWADVVAEIPLVVA